MRGSTRGLIVATLLLTTACGKKIVVNNIVVYENHWEQTKREVGQRMAFDFNCSQDQLSFTLFKRVARYPSEVGVTGCGRKVVYVRAVGQGGIGPWVANVEGANPGIDATAPQAAPPPPAR